MRILALDLGKFKSVSCCFDTEVQTTEYWTLSTDRPYLTTVLQKYQPDLVVIEACSIAAWVHDLCGELGFRILWSAIPTRKPGGGRTSSGRPTATTPSSWPGWRPSAN